MRLTDEKLTEILAKLTVALHGNILLTDVTEVFMDVLTYKQIEERFGIDLIILHKALTDGFYYIDKNGVIHDTRRYLKPVFDAYRKSIEIQEYVDNAGGYFFKNTGEYVRLCDYGITWAFTKEELERNKKISGR